MDEQTVLNFATPVISNSGTRELRTLYNAKLLSSFASLVESAENGLQTPFDVLKNRLRGIDSSRKLQPRVFAAYHALRTALEAQDIQQVNHTLEAIQQKISPPYVESGVTINTISSTGYHAAIVRDIESKNDFGTMSLVSPHVINEYDTLVREAISCIQTYASAMGNDFDTLLANLLLFKGPEGGKGLVGASDVRVFGEVYLRVNDLDQHPIVYIAEHLTHEVSHLYLHALMAFDPLILNSSEERYEAPIRPDLRPMFGIYHATFVLSRMVWVFSNIVQHQPEPHFTEALALFQKQFRKGFEVVTAHAKLTEAGRKIVDGYSQMMEG